MGVIISIERAARHYKISSIKVHMLIRQGKIKKHVERFKWCVSEVKIDRDNLATYFEENPETLQAWQRSFEESIAEKKKNDYERLHGRIGEK